MEKQRPDDEIAREMLALEREEAIKEKVDEKGVRWKKVYFGSGAHFRNWLTQCIEIYGEKNVEVEETDAVELRCYEGGERMCRIWVREASSPRRR